MQQYVDRLPAMAEQIRELFPALVEVEKAEGDARVVALGQQAAAGHLGELGDYRIVREIGRGGMGVVYEAEQVSLGRRVAGSRCCRRWASPTLGRSVDSNATRVRRRGCTTPTSCRSSASAGMRERISTSCSSSRARDSTRSYES